MSSRFEELTIRADAAEVRRASEWLDAACQRHDIPRGPVERLLLCLNEALENIIMHGGGGALAEPIVVMFEVKVEQECGEAGVTVSDTGKAFDPLSVSPKSSAKSLEGASLGGLGLTIIRRFSDWVRYRNEGGRNHLTFGTRWRAR